MKKKKQKDVVVEETPQVEVAVATPKKPVKKDSWEVKDRTYILKGKKEPLTYTIPSRHTRRHPLLWFDTEKNSQRELRYATNMSSPFVALQKLLSLYHPMLKTKYYEHVPQMVAEDELEKIEWEIEALNAARNMDIDIAEAIVRVEYGSKVNKLSSKELRRDLLILAKTNPKLFLSLAADENVQLRNFAINAIEQDIITLSQDQRSIHWASNNRKLMTVPFDENPYSALAAWFKTDEGVEVFRSIEKRLN